MRGLASFAVAIAIAVSPAPLWAGEWHSGAKLVCSDCHTQHNSSGGAPMRTDGNPNPARMLLLRGTTTDLCLSCHDGGDAASPDVIEPVGYILESAAGFFPNSGGTSTSHAHHLNNPTAEMPPGGTIAMVLTCTTCHDPHGNDNYRNLRPDPTRTGQAPVTVLAHEKKKPGAADPSDVYAPANVVYKSGVSAWCGRCHGTVSIPTDHPGTAFAHPTDVRIWSSAQASYARWTSTILPRVAIDSPADNVIPSTDDRVQCLSCHKAHGSANPAMLIFADGATQASTCGECHDP